MNKGPGDLNFKINIQDKPTSQYGATNDVIYLSTCLYNEKR